jgi:hypothetical protein
MRSLALGLLVPILVASVGGTALGGFATESVSAAHPAGVTRVLRNDTSFSYTTHGGQFRIKAVIQDMSLSRSVPCRVTVRLTSYGHTPAVYRLVSWRFGVIKTTNLNTSIARGSHRITVHADVRGVCRYFLVY